MIRVVLMAGARLTADRGDEPSRSDFTRGYGYLFVSGVLSVRDTLPDEFLWAV